MKNVIVLVLLCTAVLTSCKKKVNDTDFPDFIGTWFGESGDIDYDLMINSGTVSQYNWTNEVTLDFDIASGIAKIKEGKNELYIGSETLTIDTYPAENASGDWTMKLSGITYTKY